MTTAEPSEQVYALMTSTYTHHSKPNQACPSPTSSQQTSDPVPSTSSSENIGSNGEGVDEGKNGIDSLPKTTVLSTQSDNVSYINSHTILDSGASNHCFIDRSCFLSYETFDFPQTGCAADKNSTFDIRGKCVVNCTTFINNTEVKISMSDVLHTPNLRSNLISISKLVSKGVQVRFEGNDALVTSGGKVIMIGTKCDGLYTTDLAIRIPTALISQVKRKAVTFDVWHRRLGHVGADIIRRMVAKSQVTGIDIKGLAEIKGICEDCVFGKHSARPYNEHTPTEENVLNRIHIDIWGPASTQSAGGAKYFMLLVDGASSYCQAYFLSSKSADVTLKVFQDYLAKAERQTGKKLKWVRMDMGKEWLNS